MKTLFLIPARGGSKGLPGKNLAPLAGIPLVGWATRVACQALRAHPESRVVCSTDDDAIAEAARAWGAEVPFTRPAELATGSARSVDVVNHALDELNEDFDAVALLQPTSPLTELGDILESLDDFQKNGDPVISVTQAEHPPEWHLRVDDRKQIHRVLPDAWAHRRQEAPPAFSPNGAIYVASMAQVRSEGFWGHSARALIMPAERSIDIDQPLDLVLAETHLDLKLVAPLQIDGRRIGPGEPAFLIAEAGVNHNGSLDTALRLVDVAAEAGVDAIKFQTYKTERLVSSVAPKAAYQRKNTNSDGSQMQMLRELELTASQHRKIQAHCQDRGILFLSTPFDIDSLELLVGMGVPALKIGSGEITNHDLLASMARTGLPLLMSTGMSSMVEVDRSVSILRHEGASQVALLHCVSNYPAAPEDCNLSAMQSMRRAFGLPVGWSDHTLGIHIALAGVANGASIIEKHFTLDRSLPGPDHAASIEPVELRALAEGVRGIELSLGEGQKTPCESEGETLAVARRSVHAAQAMAAGHSLTSSDLVLLRPGTGIPASEAAEVVGRVLKRGVQAGDALSEDDLL